MKNIILFGAPGAGKGTQAVRIAEIFTLKHLSTGDILRQAIAKRTPIGQEAQTYINQGLLVPDALVIGIIKQVIEEHPQIKGFIFDGFPRTLQQAHALEQLLESFNTSIHAVVNLIIPDEEIIKRILLRGKVSGRADDQEQSIIQARIDTYHRETAPVADFYAQQKRLYSIDGMGSIDLITERLITLLGEMLR